MTLRKEIRAAAKSLIVAASTGAADRVYTGRVFSFYRATFPLIAIYTPQENNQVMGNAPTEYEKVVTLSVQLIDGNSDEDSEDAIDDLANEVEAALNDDSNFGLSDISRVDFLSSQTELLFDDKADKHYVSCTLSFAVHYIECVTPAEASAGITESVEVNGSTVSRT